MKVVMHMLTSHEMDPVDMVEDYLVGVGVNWSTIIVVSHDIMQETARTWIQHVHIVKNRITLLNISCISLRSGKWKHFRTRSRTRTRMFRRSQLSQDKNHLLSLWLLEEELWHVMINKIICIIEGFNQPPNDKNHLMSKKTKESYLKPELNLCRDIMEIKLLVLH